MQRQPEANSTSRYRRVSCATLHQSPQLCGVSNKSTQIGRRVIASALLVKPASSTITRATAAAAATGAARDAAAVANALADPSTFIC